MAAFTIDSENNIAAHAELPASADNLQTFATEKELGKLSPEWLGSRLVEIWTASRGNALRRAEACEGICPPPARGRRRGRQSSKARTTPSLTGHGHRVPNPEVRQVSDVGRSGIRKRSNQCR